MTVRRVAPVPQVGWRICVVAFALALAGCGGRAEGPPLDLPAPPSPVSSSGVTHPPRPFAENPPGLSNVVQAGDGIFSGCEPHGEEGFVSLAGLGIKTVVSVDGATPNVGEAHRQGIRYVHIPIGYDGVPERAQQGLTRVARDADRPIYVHCHHGRHRGPAATAIVCIAAGQKEAKDALLILEIAGTGKEYPGLWRDVAAFSPAATGIALPELAEVAQVDSLPAAMASIDRHWDNLKLCRQADWQVPRDHPDLSPAQEALLLREALHEAGRSAPRDKIDAQMRDWLDHAESLAVQIEKDLKDAKLDGASRNISMLEQSCKRCHARYRN